MQKSINFQGYLYARNAHTTKPIVCCHHGDAKFIKLLNNSSKKNLKIFFENNTLSLHEKEGISYIKIKTKEIPAFNLFEKFIFNISSLQKKAIKQRKKGVYTELIFVLNEFEFEYLKKYYSFITKNQLKYFEEFIKKYCQSSERELAKNFFSPKDL